MQNTYRILIGIILSTALVIGGTTAIAPASVDAPNTPTEARYTELVATVDGAGAAPRPATPSTYQDHTALTALIDRPAPRHAPSDRILAVDPNGSKFSAADPSIERDGDRWLVFTTQAYWSSVPVWESTDMINWSFVGDALPTLPEWAGGLTWAPDAVEIDGQWVLFFSSLWGDTKLHCIGHAVADAAAGPYEPFDEPIVCPLEDGGAIDAMVHIDGAGDPHLLWKVDANAIGRASVLVSQPLTADGTALTGEPTEILRYDGGWEWPLIEQPELIEIDGTLHLFYAAGWYNTDNYQVGHAICETAAGPCHRTSDSGGWLTTDGRVAGPGALSVAEADDGLVGVYHAWIDAVDGPDEFRSLVVQPLEWGADLPV